MNSSWDTSQAHSVYHFDNTQRDARWDAVHGLGRFSPCWDAELEEIIEKSRPATWETRGYKAQGADIPREDLAAEEHDLERVGADPKMTITHLNWNIPPVLKRMSDLFALDDCMNRIHVQKPGELWNLHIDKLGKWAPKDPDSVVRIMIQLTDWQPGQFWEFGNYHWNQWCAGDVVIFDWRNVPHSTANAGHHARVTFQITGVKTAQTEEFLKTLRNTAAYNI
jgi:hypothetical protein